MATYHVAATDERGWLTAPSVLAQIDARTKATMRADLPALADELNIGSGSGIEQVSGTVTLDATGPAIREVYATAKATVQGEQLEAGSAALFRFFNGAWQVRVMNPDGSVKDRVWRAVGATPAPDPGTGTGPTTVVLNVDDVSFKDAEGSASDTYTLAAKTGVTWKVSVNDGAAAVVQAGTHAVSPAGAKIVVTATPASSSYVLTGQTTWSKTFDASTPVSWTTTTFRDTFTRANGNIFGTTADTGQVWKESAYFGKIVGGKYAPGAPNRHNYVPVAGGDQSLRAKVTLVDAPSAVNSVTFGLRGNTTFDSPNTSAANVIFEDRADSTGRVVIGPIPATMTFNQEGRKEANGAVSYWSHVSGWVPGQTQNVRVDLRGSTITVYVNDARIVEGTFSAEQMATFAGQNLHVWGNVDSAGTVDDLEVLTP